VKVVVKYSKIDNVPLPQYQSDGASGLDLYSAEEVTIKPGEYQAIRTGIALEIPRGYEGQIRPRSGLALKYGIGILNSPGTIDSDYRGEIKVILFNFGKKPFKISKGYRIAQIVFSRISKVSLKEAKHLSPTRRNKGGFGHTGLKD
jgi:dUTP pyrophosphatase